MVSADSTPWNLRHPGIQKASHQPLSGPLGQQRTQAILMVLGVGLRLGRKWEPLKVGCWPSQGFPGRGCLSSSSIGPEEIKLCRTGCFTLIRVTHDSKLECCLCENRRPNWQNNWLWPLLRVLCLARQIHKASQITGWELGEWVSTMLRLLKGRYYACVAHCHISSSWYSPWPMGGAQ